MHAARAGLVAIVLAMAGNPPSSFAQQQNTAPNQSTQQVLSLPAEDIESRIFISVYKDSSLEDLYFARRVGGTDIDISMKAKPLELRGLYEILHQSLIPRPLLDAENALSELASRLANPDYFRENLYIYGTRSDPPDITRLSLKNGGPPVENDTSIIRLQGMDYKISFDVATESKLVKIDYNGKEVEADEIIIKNITNLRLESAGKNPNSVRTIIEYHEGIMSWSKII